MTMWTIMQAVLLVLNAFAILNEDRFLIPCEFAPHEPFIVQGRHGRGAPAREMKINMLIPSMCTFLSWAEAVPEIVQ